MNGRCEADAERCFVPPYVGVNGWLGVRLDRGLPWPFVEAQVRDAWLRAAPARVRALAESPPAAAKPERLGAARSPRRNA